ncbi:MAG: hypothetical protein EBR93_02320 [Bacteroidetes bacterium]|nr:hypothetical protein [Bacteroidota bacterium]
MTDPHHRLELHHSQFHLSSRETMRHNFSYSINLFRKWLELHASIVFTVYVLLTLQIALIFTPGNIHAQIKSLESHQSYDLRDSNRAQGLDGARDLNSAHDLRTVNILYLPAGQVETEMEAEIGEINERTALFKSLILPGWGHFGLDASASTRGRIHIGTDLALLAGYFGVDRRVGSLTKEYLALGELRAGVLMADRDRAFVLAMGNFDSLEEYNDYQLRSRNWNRLIEDAPGNRWQWEQEEDRRRFKNIRERADQMENQLPAIVGFMVINRVISGISAFNQTRRWNADRTDRGELEVIGDFDGVGGVGKERTMAGDGGTRKAVLGEGVGMGEASEAGEGNGVQGATLDSRRLPPQFSLMPVFLDGRNTGFTAHLRFSF